MQAYGSDRLRLREDGTAILSCRSAKENWQARIPKTLTTPQHPGTAVAWEDEYWEIVAVEVTQSGVRYTLEGWPESAAMRLVVRYDEVAEAERAQARQRAYVRERGRKAATALGFLTGHLPAAVQQELASEIGINPVRLTMVSAIPPLAGLGFVIFLLVGNVMRAAGAEAGPLHRIPLSVVGVLAFMGVESLVRFLSALSAGKPVGSSIGVIGYAIYYGLARDRSKLVRPFAAERGSSVKTTELTAEEKLQSDLTLVEPLFSLLDLQDQRTVAQRYGVNYRNTATMIAGILLVFSFFGVITSFGSVRQLHLSGFISLIVAGWLFAEQVWRFVKFQQGPAPSILRFVVRPFLTRYLA
jgi:hypothetical protein